MTYLYGLFPTALAIACSVQPKVTSSPHIVQVVSILEAPRRLGSVSFQSKEVRGAQNSEFLFCKWMREGGEEGRRKR